MKKGVTSLLFIIPLLGAVMLFQACPFGLSRAKAETVQPYQRPFWAVNKPGTIELYIPDIDTIVEYSPKTLYNTTYTLVVRSTIYTGENKNYPVRYEIISSVLGRIIENSTSIGEAYYESTSGRIDPNETDLGSFNFVIPPNLEGLLSVNLVINYNITGLLTKINIPMQIKKPPSGTFSVVSVPIFYSASPIVPKENTARVEVTSKRVIVSFNITDAVGCLSGDRRISINYNYRLKYAGKEVDKEIISCMPSSPLKSLPTEIRCTINLERNQDILSSFASQAGVYLELEINISPYNCAMSKLYTISIRKYE